MHASYERLRWCQQPQTFPLLEVLGNLTDVSNGEKRSGGAVLCCAVRQGEGKVGRGRREVGEERGWEEEVEEEEEEVGGTEGGWWRGEGGEGGSEGEEGKEGRG